MTESSLNILIVDDNKEHQQLMKESIEESLNDVTIEISDTGKDCLHKLSGKVYDMLFIDFSLSGANGLDLLREVVQREINVPVVMVTAFGNETVAVEAMKLGAYDYIVKSDTYLTKLSATILRVVNEHRLREEKREVERKLIKSESKYRTLIENIIDIVFVADNDLNIISINPACQRIIECSVEDAEKVNVYELIFEPDKKMVVDYFKKAFLSKKLLIESLEFRIKTKKDNIKHVELNAKVDYGDGNSKKMQIEGVMRDITERKKIEYKLSHMDKLNALALQSSGIAHEFNNILGIILGYLKILKLKLKDSSPQVNDAINVIEKAAMDGATIVDKVQQFSRTRPEGDEIRHIDLIDTLHEAVEFTMPRWKSEAESKNLEYQIVTDSLVSSRYYVRCNPSELREVIVNVINNSIDAMPDGGKIVFSTRSIDENVILSISDSGTGIKDEIKDKIFDPFFTTKGVKGYGLGMSVAYSIITKFNGEINIDSRSGEGTTVHIKIPLFSPEETKHEAKDVSITDHKANILVIEDEEVILEMLKIILEEKGHKVSVAKDANVGLELYQNNRYDVVLCDLGMPKLNGWKVARYIKDFDAARDEEKTPVILITGYELDTDNLDYRKEGVDFILKKPLEFEELNKMINNFIMKS